MRINLSSYLLGALALELSTNALPSPFARPLSDGGSTTLKPIKIRDYESAMGIHRRSTEQFSDLDPQDQSQFIYGQKGTHDQFVLANLTLYAADGLQIVTMERFEPLTSKVDCKGDDGLMSLTFKSKAAFQHALKTWAYINESVEKKFLLIANHAGCGPDDERQPYIISKIREDQSKLTTFLTAKPAKWSEIAHTYDLDFGKVATAKRSHQARDFIGDIGSGLENIGQDIGDTAKKGVDAIGNGVQNVADEFSKLGDFDLDKSVSFSVAVGQPNQVTNIVTQSSLKVDCINCFVTGSFQLTGHISVKGFKLQDLTLDASPQGVAATLELGTTITAKDSPDSLQFTKQLFSAPIPGAGIAVPGIFNLGATIEYDVGVSTTFAGSATFNAGLSASLPDTAKVVADINTPDQSSATGFDAASLTPLFDVTTLSASVTVAAFTQPKLAFGIELTDVGQFDVNINVKLPSVSATLSAKFDEKGVCSQDPGASKTGVELTSEIDVEVDLGVDASIGSNKAPAFSKKLFGISHPLFSHCFPINIPGLSPASASVAPVPTTAPLPADTSIVQNTPLPSVTPAVPISSISPVPSVSPVPSISPVASSPVPIAPSPEPVAPSSSVAPLPLSTNIHVVPSGTAPIPYPTKSYNPVVPSGTAPVSYPTNSYHPIVPSGTAPGTGYVGPTGTGASGVGPSGTLAPYPIYGNSTRKLHVRRAVLREGAVVA